MSGVKEIPLVNPLLDHGQLTTQFLFSNKNISKDISKDIFVPLHISSNQVQFLSHPKHRCSCDKGVPPIFNAVPNFG